MVARCIKKIIREKMTKALFELESNYTGSRNENNQRLGRLNSSTYLNKNNLLGGKQFKIKKNESIIKII
jgi:hypothetical protein